MKQPRNRLTREMTGTVPALRQPGDACGRARAVANVETSRRAKGPGQGLCTARLLDLTWRGLAWAVFRAEVIAE
jgi:hypothetical protein